MTAGVEWPIRRRRKLKPEPIEPSIPLEAFPQVDGGYGCIMADPPWRFRSRSARVDPTKSRMPKYRTMVFDEIKRMPVAQLAARDCHLFLWITGPLLMRGEELMRAWGFRYSSSGFVWIKLKASCGRDEYQWISLHEIEQFLHMGTGYTTRKNCEFLLQGRRGSPKRMARNVLEPIISPVREHSRKPDEAYRRVERYVGDVAKLDLFTRQVRPGWDAFGDEAEKFEAIAA